MSLIEYREFKKCDDLYVSSLRLRYQVYCLEWGFENPEDYPDGMESDYYDEHNMCVYVGAIYKPDNRLIATARIIRVPSLEPMLPIEKEYIRRDRVGEISRFSITKDFNRRQDDVMSVYNKENFNPDETDPKFIERRKSENDITTGLLKALAEQSALVDIAYWYCVMAKGLFKLLSSKGVNFIQIGPEKKYHGIRRPYIGHLRELFSGNDYLLESYRKATGDIDETNKLI